jgi:hypothetical protein
MTETLDRREFTLRSAMAVLSGVAITISGCGGGSSSPTGSSGGPSAGAGDKVGAISGNHGHSAVITSAQMSGGSLDLNIRGNADHPHTVSLTAAELSSIAGGQRVSKTSSNTDSHNHTVTFN